RGGVRRANQTDLGEVEAELLGPDRQEHVEDVGEAVVDEVGAGGGGEHRARAGLHVEENTAAEVSHDDQHHACLHAPGRQGQDLEPLKSFTLPGGGRINAFLHQARTVCRRAEREVLKLTRVEPVNEWALRYVNRLSDAFFVLGRWVGKHMSEKEYLWERGLSAHSRPRKKR